ncbi:alpha/beta fold hydrolase [Caulobacter sp. DWR3-1-2]|uniref:alpha/beta fold hydrolase n=1 Tax=Caulobacter sp. DWR3-1-2 TaxID=2804647 RepID=UPI003CF0180F
MRKLATALAACAAFLASAAIVAPAWAAPAIAPKEGNFVVRDFKFRSGETLPELRLHYTTFGEPKRDAAGHVTNAVMVLHGTGGTGKQFLNPAFADTLMAPGGLLDPAEYYVILPDGIGHGQSSKPSDGLRAKFPKYDYDDMVLAQYLLLTQGLKVDHLRLLLGTSMGCMHGFVWGEAYPDFADALASFACLPNEIAGRNRIWRKLLIDAVTQDPAWKGGDYVQEPREGLRTALGLLMVAGLAPLPTQIAQPTRDAADKFVDDYFAARLSALDANDLIYQVAASRNYNPSPRLDSITQPVLWINSADDFINPPELGIAEVQAKRLKHGTFVLLPASEKTRGHGSHTIAALWKDRLAALMKATER